MDTVPSALALRDRLAQIFLGQRKDIRDPGIFHRLALIPFLAWVGLGADGLSSSAYGPEEAFKALGHHRYLAVGLALATAITVLVLSYSYARIIENFPEGGGGYVVATKLLGSRIGMVSGSALLVDYVLTITTSVASGGDAIFSFLPPEWLHHKFTAQLVIVALLTIINLRGVRESVVALMPFFVLFLGTHAILLGVGIFSHVRELPALATTMQADYHAGIATLGVGGMLLLFLRAYSLGAGTYTGIEAVSNGLALMREPRVETGKRTMLYMAISLSVVAAGVLMSYLILGVSPVPGKTMNALISERVAAGWDLGWLPLGRIFVVLTLFSEAVLLFVAAQAGFIGGPRVVANMATDSWLPHRFSALSDRLTTQNGVLLMGGCAAAALVYTHGSVSKLIVMYSINVFVTFALSEIGMIRFYREHRSEHPDWRRKIVLFMIGAVMCTLILGVVVYEKFMEGGWLTLVVTTAAVAVCIFIRRHYLVVRRGLTHLDELFSVLPTKPAREDLGPLEPLKPTAALLVGGYGGLGVHSLLTLLRMFPKHFHNVVFISVGVLDSGNFKGAKEVDALTAQTRLNLDKYVDLSRRLGLPAEGRMAIGTDVVAEASRLGLEVAREFPQTTFFSGQLIFERRQWYHRLLHNETAYAIQHRLQFQGHPMVILPVRVRERELATAAREHDDPADMA